MPHTSQELKEVLAGSLNSPIGDAFGRLRISEPHTVFDSKMISGDSEIFFDEVTNGTGATNHISGNSLVEMSVSANEDYVIRQTFMRFDYQAGKSQLIYLTGILHVPVPSTESKIGYFNTSSVAPYTADCDGIYFGQDGSNIYVAISKLGIEDKVIQDNWNLDNMNGFGPSKIKVDFNKPQIFIIDFEWLGVGRVRCGLNIGGVTYYVHEFTYANEVDANSVYMKSPNHSIRYEVRSTGGSVTIKQVCSSVQSEGGVEPSGISRGINTGITTQTVSTTLEALIGYRLKSTHLDATVLTEMIGAMSTANEDTLWELQLNPTYANTPSWNSAGTSSPIEYAVGNGSNTVSASGEILATGYGSDDLNNINLLVKTIIHAGVAIDGTRDEIWLCVSTLSGSGDYVASINVKEIAIG